MSHQQLVLTLVQLLLRFVSAQDLGTVLFAPLRVQLWPEKFREPDIVFMRREHANRMSEAFWDGADLVVEVVSPDDRRRDLETKRREYAQAAIPEYWIVDPEVQRIVVLTLAGAEYAVHGQFSRGVQATSVLLPGFVVDVADLFAAVDRSAAA
jgi:Uma2 family endonuclease